MSCLTAACWGGRGPRRVQPGQGSLFAVFQVTLTADSPGSFI